MKTSREQLCTLFIFCGFSGGILCAQPAHAILPILPPSVSTVPDNGDSNPYGVAVVPRSLFDTSVLQPGDILVSNFNGLDKNMDAVQGTGTTIVHISQTGNQTLFFQGSGLGFTGALGILSSGIVVAGSMPTTDGTAATAKPGSLLFLDPRGNLLTSMANNAINGPWGLTVNDFGGGLAQIFVSNVLSGTVMRFDVTYNGGGQVLNIFRTVQVASGYSHRPDPGAVVLGPSGLAYDARRDILYVANSADNAIYAVFGAGSSNSLQGTGTAIFNDATKLHGPVNMVLAPNGHLIVSNSDGGAGDTKQPSELVEITPGGQFIGEFSVDPSVGGSFGIAVTSISPGVVRLTYVDDNENTVNFATTVLQ